MLIDNFYEIGNRLLHYRKRAGLTQMEVAEKAGIADRTYADIERGTVNMRIETLLRICAVLRITPDEVLTRETENADDKLEEMIVRLKTYSEKDRTTAYKLLQIYLDSIS